MSYHPDQLIVSDNSVQLFQDSAENIVEYVRQCVKLRNICHIALAGGSTPQKLYQTLSCSPLSEQIPWSSCHFYFGDERMVAHDHKDSNYLMAKQSLFDPASVPNDNIHAIPTHCQLQQDCADLYAQELIDVPVLDLVLLGIGQDGHTASLFPGTAILNETTKNVSAVFVKKLDAWRISLTSVYINKARCVMVLIQGHGKNAIVKQLLTQEDTGQYPITTIRPDGQLIWHIDKEACDDCQ